MLMPSLGTAIFGLGDRDSTGSENAPSGKEAVMQNHTLDGLMKCAQRDDWREMFEDVLNQHLGIACDQMDVDAEDLPDFVDGNHLMNLWGCAFEDLIASEIDGKNLADDYLKRRGWKESAGKRAYIRALRQSVMCLYEVSGIRRDEGFFLRDLVRGGEPVWVNEKSGTHGLVQWDRLAARVVTVNGRVQLGGGLLVFDRATSDELIDELRAVAKAKPEDLAQALEQLAEEVGEEIDDETSEIIDALKATNIEMTIEKALASSGFLFSTYWLRNALEKKLTPPEVFNSDGDPFEPTNVIYPLADHATPRKVRAALARIPALRQEDDDFWNWLRPRDSTKKELPKNGRVLFSEMEDGSTVIGTIRLDEDTLMFSANSSARAARGRELIEPVLGDLVLEPEVERQTVDEMMSDADEEGAARKDDLVIIPPESQIETMWKYIDDHYKRILDEPVTALGGISPREAARTVEWREKAVDWVKSVENNHAHMALANPARHYDCGWLWDELGLGSYRHPEEDGGNGLALVASSKR